MACDMKKAFDLVLGSVVCLFGLVLGWVFLKTIDFGNLVLNRKLVLSVVVPATIVLVGLKRIFTRRAPAPRN